MSTGWVASGTKSLVGINDTGTLLEDLSTRANFSTILGYEAGKKATGVGNTVMGYQAAQNTTLANNAIVLGQAAGKDNQGSSVIYIGNNTGGRTGGNNVFVGHDVGLEADASEFNVVMGNTAFRNATGNFNVAIGYQNDRFVSPKIAWNTTSLGALTTATGFYNVALGAYNQVGDCSNATLLGTSLRNSGTASVLIGNNINNSGKNSLIVGRGTADQPLVNTRDDYINIFGVIQGTVTDGIQISASNTTLSTPGGAAVGLCNNTLVLAAPGGIQLQGSLLAQNPATFNSTVLFNSNLVSQGSATFNDRLVANSNFVANGVSLFTGPTSLLSQTSISGATSLTGGTEISGGLRLDSSVFLTDRASFSGIARFTSDVIGSNAFFSNLSVPGRIQATGSLSVGCNLQVGGALQVNGPTTLNDDLAVLGNSELTTLQVAGPSVFHDDAQFAGDVDLDGAVVAQGPVNMRSNVSVGGSATFASEMSIKGPLVLDGSNILDIIRNNPVLYSGLNVLGGPLKVNGQDIVELIRSNSTPTDVFPMAVTFCNRVGIEGDLWLYSNLYVVGQTRMFGGLRVDGDVQLDGAVDVAGPLHVATDSEFQADLRVGDRLMVGGTLQAKDFEVTGTTELRSNVAILGDLQVSSANARFDNNLSVDNNLRVSAEADIAGPLFLGGCNILDLIAASGSSSSNNNLWTTPVTFCNQVNIAGGPDQLLLGGSNLRDVLQAACAGCGGASNGDRPCGYDTDVPGDLRIAGDLHVAGNLHVDLIDTRTSLGVDQIVAFNQDVTFRGSAWVASDFQVGDQSRFGGLAQFDADAKHYGKIQLTHLSSNMGHWDIRLENSTTSPCRADLVFVSKHNTVITFMDEFDTGLLNFTAKHRCLALWPQGLPPRPGMILVATGQYRDLDGGDVPTIDESIPVLRVCTLARDTAVFGVLARVTHDTSHHTFRLGNMCFRRPKQTSPTLCKEWDECGLEVEVNAAGEGGILVCDINGPLRVGDLVCAASHVPGVGMRQRGTIRHSYTVAKATCACDFATPLYTVQCERKGLVRVAFIGCVYMLGG
jgi:cytoskeletal protein CcmA (bactofilin family)